MSNEWEKDCTSFAPGHNVNPLQACGGVDDEVDRLRSGHISAIEGQLFEVQFDDGDFARFRHHNTARLGPYAPAEVGSRVKVAADRNLMLLGTNFDQPVNAAPDRGEELDPCEPADDHAKKVEAVRHELPRGARLAIVVEAKAGPTVHITVVNP